MTDIDFKYSHAAILVSNLERSMDFYQRAVGWTHSFTLEQGSDLGEANAVGGSGRISFGLLGGVPLEFVEMQVPLERRSSPNHYGLFLVSVTVSEIEPVLKRLAENNIPITRDVQVTGVRLLVLTDPDGQEVCIIYSAPAENP